MYPPRIKRSRIITDTTGFFQPYDAGHLAIILAVHGRAGAIVDSVAWLPDRPSRWWMRRGVAPLLGEAEVERAADLAIPLWLLPTPIDWLLNHARGGYWPAACITDWAGFDPRPALMGVRIITACAGLAARLEAAQVRADRPLRIEVAGVRHVA